MMHARWESPRGKHWVELHSAADGFRYRGSDCGGFLAAKTLSEARAELQAKIDAGYFLPDIAKQPMQEVT
jgi:hypothetical protein